MGKTAVFQMQDVMALDNEARMNTPGKAVGNWAWRMGDTTVWTELKASAARLYNMNKLYDRCGPLRMSGWYCTHKAQAPQGRGAAAQGAAARTLAVDGQRQWQGGGRCGGGQDCLNDIFTKSVVCSTRVAYLQHPHKVCAVHHR